MEKLLTYNLFEYHQNKVKSREWVRWCHRCNNLYKTKHRYSHICLKCAKKITSRNS